MSASVIEQILARVKAALLNATAAGVQVYRGRQDAFAETQLPAINIKRSGSNHEPLGDRADVVIVQFDVEHHVAATVDWETAADVLHMESHALILTDATLATLGRGLRCTGTDAQGGDADQLIGLLTASYQIKVPVRRGDFTRAMQ